MHVSITGNENIDKQEKEDRNQNYKNNNVNTTIVTNSDANAMANYKLEEYSI